MATDTPTRYALASRQLNRRFVTLLARAMDVHNYPPHHYDTGQVVMRSGDVPDALPLVDKGMLTVFVLIGEEGQRVVPVGFEDGEMAMVSLLFSDSPSTSELMAGGPTVLRWIPRRALEQVISGDAAMLLALVRFLAQRLREVQVRERGWMDRGVHERIAAALARAVRDAAPQQDGPVHIVATHEQLAERAGVSRPRLSQELKQLEQAGILRLRRGSVDVLDPRRLPGLGT